jgi:prolyl-tRNA synthetase
MRFWSRYFIPTLKESPSDAEIASHRLLIRAGLVRRLGGGLYTYLPLGLRVMQKISRICREEMERSGAIELSMPHVHPAEFWAEGPRWGPVREIMYRVDSAGEGKRGPREPEFVLGPTHEEVITPLMKAEIGSYRDLPKTFFQIGTKFRNEIRPRFGLMRAREFVMMDAYSFDADDAGAVRSYEAMKAAYEAFFRRVGARAICGRGRHRRHGRKPFPRVHGAGRGGGQRPALQRGERLCRQPREGEERPSCRRASRTRRRSGPLEEFPTPGVVTIAALEAPPYSVPADRQFKTLVYIGDGRPLRSSCGDATSSRRRSWDPRLHARAAGDAGGDRARVGREARQPGNGEGHDQEPARLAGIYADHAIRLVGNGTTGANRDGFHLRNVNVTRDLEITRFGDFRRVLAGRARPVGGRPLKIRRGIEVGHIFKLGTKYSERIDAGYTDDKKAPGTSLSWAATASGSAARSRR